MKKILLFANIFLFICSIPALTKAQNPIANPVIAQEEGLRQTSFLQKKVTLPTTPEAASLGKYGDVNVNLYTGSVNLNIPIYTIQGKDISLPINLSYDGSGNKVDNLGTWVGLGWTLQAGGVVTKVVKANPDEKGNYYDRGTQLEELKTLVNAGIPKMRTEDLKQLVMIGDLESQPDNYYYNYNGQAGKFYFKPGAFASLTGNVIQKESKDVIITPTFETDGDISQFTIKDEYGNTYYFEASEYTDYVIDAGQNTNLIDWTYDYKSAWYLTKIVSANQNEEIILSYFTVTTPFTQPYNIRQNESLAYGDGTIHCGSEACGYTNVGQWNYLGENVQKVYNRKFLLAASYKLDGATIEQVEFDHTGHTIPYTL